MILRFSDSVLASVRLIEIIMQKQQACLLTSGGAGGSAGPSSSLTRTPEYPGFPSASFPLGAYHGYEPLYLIVIGGTAAPFTPDQAKLF